jgi:hypothetical protein
MGNGTGECRQININGKGGKNSTQKMWHLKEDLDYGGNTEEGGGRIP